MKPKLKELAALFPSTETEVVIFCAAEDIEPILQKDVQFFPAEKSGIVIAEESEVTGGKTVKVNDTTFHFVPHTHQKEFILSLADSIRVDTEVNYPETLGAEPDDKDMPPADGDTGNDDTGIDTDANTETNEDATA